MLKIKLAAVAATILIVSFGVTANAQTPIADYQLQDNYNSSVGTIGPLTVVGNASDATFTNGVTVDGHTQDVLTIATGSLAVGTDIGAGVQSQTKGFLTSPANYSVVLLADFGLSTDIAATKVMDFKNLSTDDGLYINDATGELEFNQVSNQPLNVPLITTGVAPPVVADTYTQIVLTRDSSTNLVSIYQNGDLDFTVTDSDGLAILGDVSGATNPNADLTVFKDDGTGLGGTLVNETTIGDIAGLRLYDGVLTADQVAELDTVVPEPVCGMTLMLVLGTAVVRRRRIL